MTDGVMLYRALEPAVITAVPPSAGPSSPAHSAADFAPPRLIQTGKKRFAAGVVSENSNLLLSAP